jgi:hypothetical protein
MERGHPVRQRAQPAPPLSAYETSNFERARAARSGGEDVRAPYRSR